MQILAEGNKGQKTGGRGGQRFAKATNNVRGASLNVWNHAGIGLWSALSLSSMDLICMPFSHSWANVSCYISVLRLFRILATVFITREGFCLFVFCCLFCWFVCMAFMHSLGVFLIHSASGIYAYDVQQYTYIVPANESTHKCCKMHTLLCDNSVGGNRQWCTNITWLVPYTQEKTEIEIQTTISSYCINAIWSQ